MHNLLSDDTHCTSEACYNLVMDNRQSVDCSHKLQFRLANEYTGCKVVPTRTQSDNVKGLFCSLNKKKKNHGALPFNNT